MGDAQPCTIDAKGEEIDGTSTMILPLEIIRDHIFPMIRPRGLLNFSCTCKFFLSSLSHKIVVNNVIGCGRYQNLDVDKEDTPETRMIDIAKLLFERRIHAPSPIRLLRLVLGTRCEQRDCIEKCKFDKSHAIHICEWCKPAFICESQGPWEETYLSLPDRLRRKRLKSCPRMIKPYIDSSGETAGPIFTISYLHQMKNAGNNQEAQDRVFESLNFQRASSRCNILLPYLFALMKSFSYKVENSFLSGIELKKCKCWLDNAIPRSVLPKLIKNMGNNGIWSDIGYDATKFIEIVHDLVPR